MEKLIILGIVQGLTEFIPVSSSGHLVVVGYLLGITENQVAFSVILHLGTICSLFLFFYKDIINVLKDKKQVGLLILVTAITGIIGILGKDFFESLFSAPRYVGVALFVTGCLLVLSKFIRRGSKESLTVKTAIVLGLMQSVAIIPGISRSGMTIITLLMLGFTPLSSFRISFLAAIPVLCAASVLEIKPVFSAAHADMLPMIAGFLVSGIVGVGSLWFLRSVMQKAKFYYFGFYCIILSAVILLLIR